MSKAVKLRKYRVQWTTPACGFQRALTLRAANKQQALKLVSDRYPGRNKHQVQCLKPA